MPIIPDNMPPAYVYDTKNATLLNPMGESVDHTSSVVNGNHVIWTSSFSIGSAAFLRVIGDKPLIIASKTSIDIAGTLNASSFFHQS